MSSQRAARGVARGLGALGQWVGAREPRARSELERLRSALTARPGRHPSAKRYARAAADWWAPASRPEPTRHGPSRHEPARDEPARDEPARDGLSRHELSRRGLSTHEAPSPQAAPGVVAPGRLSQFAAGLSGSASAAEQWWAGVWVASIEWWAAVLAVPREADVVLEFDEAAEMVGPASHRLPGFGLSLSAVSALVHEHGSALVPRQHVVARVTEDRLLISLVSMLGVQPALPPGHYHGEASFASGLSVPICAFKRP